MKEILKQAFERNQYVKTVFKKFEIDNPFYKKGQMMLIRTAVVRRRKEHPNEILVPSVDVLAKNREEAKITILMDNAEALKKIPKGELRVVCSDFMSV